MKKLFLILLIFTSVAATAKDIQWASGVHSFSSQIHTSSYSVGQILGYPNVMPDFGQSACSWTPKQSKQDKMEWVILEFEESIHIQQIAINENFNSGALLGVYLYDSTETRHEVFRSLGIPRQPLPGRMNHIMINRTQYRCKKLKLVYKIPYNYKMIQVDAVAIADTQEKIFPKINLAKDFEFNYNPEQLPATVNSEYDELAPIISPDGKTLFFTRMYHPNNIGPNKQQDVWYSEIVGGEFTEAKLLSGFVNNQFNNFIISVTPDGNQMMVGNTYNADGSMGSGFSFSKFDGAMWGLPESIEIDDYYNLAKGTSSCLANNGKVLLVALERKDSYGFRDIFACFLKEDGTWTKPLNLGNEINTAGTEGSPFLAADNKTLYYATDSRPGYGQIDIFISKRLDDSWQNWSEPMNLGPTLNTETVESFFSITASGNFAYFSRNEEDSPFQDIYRIQLPESLKPESVVLVSGKVFNQKTNEPLEAKIIYETLDDGKEAGVAYSNPQTGEYKIVLPGGYKYGFLAEARGFIAVNENVDLTKLTYYDEIQKDLYLVPIEIGQTVRLNNIFFETGKYELLTDSYSELNRVIKLLKDYPELRIQINGHTDDVGNYSSNMTLSKKRAHSVANYLQEKGCEKKRLKVKGFGESKPVVPNTSDENRQQNRRVEFLILE